MSERGFCLEYDASGPVLIRTDGLVSQAMIIYFFVIVSLVLNPLIYSTHWGLKIPDHSGPDQI